MNPRYNRLQAEYKKLRELEERSPYVQILETEGHPPEKYALTLKCKGVTAVDGKGLPIYSYDHKLRVYLPPDFPRDRPVFEMVSQVWHPNIALAGAVCYGDEGDHGYSPSMGLDDLVIRIIEMIRYENMGLQSAFNLDAAEWTKKNQALFPLDKRQIVHNEMDIDIIDTNFLISGDAESDDNIDIVIL